MSSLIFLNTFIITILSSLLGISFNSLPLNGIAMALVISLNWLFGNLPSCAPNRPMSSPSPVTPSQQQQQSQVHFCGLYTHWSMLKFLVCSPPRKDEYLSVCIHVRSHQLSRALQWPEQEEASSPMSTRLLAPQWCGLVKGRAGSSMPTPC